MSHAIIGLFRLFGISIDLTPKPARREYSRRLDIRQRYQDFTMVPSSAYLSNLELASRVSNITGDIVECGVWRGGMIAGIAEILGSNNRKYWLFDSFEGLPPAGEMDGEAAIKWQQDKTNPDYHDNCRAEESYAREAMRRAGVTSFELVRGWFNETIPCAATQRIALLRLDGDWYESTMTCLEGLYPKVSEHGIIIIDDYYFWEGCARAVHDYLSRHRLGHRIHQTSRGVAYIIKD